MSISGEITKENYPELYNLVANYAPNDVVSTVNALVRAGIENADDLRNRNIDEISRIRTIGKKRTIILKLIKYDLGESDYRKLQDAEFKASCRKLKLDEALKTIMDYCRSTECDKCGFAMRRGQSMKCKLTKDIPKDWKLKTTYVDLSWVHPKDYIKQDSL